MFDKFLSGTGMESVSGCQHEIDEKQLPEWDKHIGRVWTCTKCGMKVCKDSQYYPMPGERIHRSKKERRRRKANGV